MRFSPGIEVCRLDGCVFCARNGPQSDALNIIRLSPLNQTFDILIIVPPFPVIISSRDSRVSRTAYWHNQAARAEFFRARAPLPVPQITAELE